MTKTIFEPTYWSSPDVYPVTSGFEQYIGSLAGHWDFQVTLDKVAKDMIEILGVYEHGEVDLPTDVTLDHYREVLTDLITALTCINKPIE